MICISSFMGPVWLSVFLFLLFSLLIVKNRGKSLSRAHFHASSPNISSKKYLESFTFLWLRKVHFDTLHPEPVTQSDLYSHAW